MECATQLADGGAGADEEVDATQPPDDAATLESTQPANDGGHACARFVRVTNPRETKNVACDQFEVLWQHSAKVYLGRDECSWGSVKKRPSAASRRRGHYRGK